MRSRLSSLPPLDDGGLSLDLGEMGPAEGTRISHTDLPAEPTHASVIPASLDHGTDRRSALPPPLRRSDRPGAMGNDPFAPQASANATPAVGMPAADLADLFADADDVLFGPDPSRPLSVAAPPPSPPPAADPSRAGSLEVDLDDLDSALDSIIDDDVDVSSPPRPPPLGRPRFTASDTVMARPFDAEEPMMGSIDEAEPTMVGSVDQFEELGLGLSGQPAAAGGAAQDPAATAQPPLGGLGTQAPLGGLGSTGASSPSEPPRSKGFLKKLFGGK